MLHLSFSALETLQSNRRHSIFFQKVNLNEMVMCLEDLINYFSQPPDDMGTYTFTFFTSPPTITKKILIFNRT